MICLFKHLFQILAHMYHSHYKELLQLKLNAYVNSIYLHLLLFGKSFNLLEDKDIEVMDQLNKALMNKYLIDNTMLSQLNIIQQPANFLNSNHQPTIHQSATSSNNSSSSGSTGFSFFKKKLNFNLMA